MISKKSKGLWHGIYTGDLLGHWILKYGEKIAALPLYVKDRNNVWYSLTSGNVICRVVGVCWSGDTKYWKEEDTVYRR